MYTIKNKTFEAGIVQTDIVHFMDISVVYYHSTPQKYKNTQLGHTSTRTTRIRRLSVRSLFID